MEATATPTVTSPPSAPEPVSLRDPVTAPEPRPTIPTPAELQAYLTDAQQHPDVTVRLQALEVWAQHPSGSVDTVTQALVDADETVRARAQELLDQAYRGP